MSIWSPTCCLLAISTLPSSLPLPFSVSFFPFFLFPADYTVTLTHLPPRLYSVSLLMHTWKVLLFNMMEFPLLIVIVSTEIWDLEYCRSSLLAFSFFIVKLKLASCACKLFLCVYLVTIQSAGPLFHCCYYEILKAGSKESCVIGARLHNACLPFYFTGVFNYCITKKCNKAVIQGQQEVKQGNSCE